MTSDSANDTLNENWIFKHNAIQQNIFCVVSLTINPFTLSVTILIANSWNHLMQTSLHYDFGCFLWTTKERLSNLLWHELACVLSQRFSQAFWWCCLSKASSSLATNHLRQVGGIQMYNASAVLVHAFTNQNEKNQNGQRCTPLSKYMK